MPRSDAGLANDQAEQGPICAYRKGRVNMPYSDLAINILAVCVW